MLFLNSLGHEFFSFFFLQVLASGIFPYKSSTAQSKIWIYAFSFLVFVFPTFIWNEQQGERTLQKLNLKVKKNTCFMEKCFVFCVEFFKSKIILI